MRWLLPVIAVTLSCSPDRDNDRFRSSVDCDDADPYRRPDAPELCDGIDSNCDGVDESDADGDGYRVCAECDDTRADVFPGAPSSCDGTDNDCDGEISEAEAGSLGEHPACPAATCAELHEARPELGDGTYWVDADTEDIVFEVDCDMRTEGGGWTRLALLGDGVFVQSSAESNPWHKCADDAAAPWPWLPDEADVPVDLPGSGRADVARPWTRPSDRYRYEAIELEALAGSVSTLHGDARLIASTNDDDGGRWQDGVGGGLEVYALDRDGGWFLLTPGTGGECGGASGWPAEGADGMQYRWALEPGASTWSGTQHPDADPDLELGALPEDLTLPVGFVLATFTGGGVAVGYDRRVVLAR